MSGCEMDVRGSRLGIGLENKDQKEDQRHYCLCWQSWTSLLMFGVQNCGKAPKQMVQLVCCLCGWAPPPFKST